MSFSISALSGQPNQAFSPLARIAMLPTGLAQSEPGVPGVEHAPAALAGRVLGGAPLADRAPIGGDEVDGHADLLEEVGGDLAHGLERRLVLRHQAGDGLARIAGLRQQLLGARRSRACP